MCSSHWLQADSQPPGDDSITLLIRQLWQKLIQEQRLDGNQPQLIQTGLKPPMEPSSIPGPDREQKG